MQDMKRACDMTRMVCAAVMSAVILVTTWRWRLAVGVWRLFLACLETPYEFHRVRYEMLERRAKVAARWARRTQVFAGPALIIHFQNGLVWIEVAE